MAMAGNRNDSAGPTLQETGYAVQGLVDISRLVH